MSEAAINKKPSAKAKTLAARLMAVQAIFQSMQNAQDMKSAAKEYLNHRVGMELDGEVLVEPDSKLFKGIVSGVADRHVELLEMLESHFSAEKQKKEQLISAILLCGSYEFMAHDDVDVPIIINDYLNVGHSFFEEGDVKFLNGLLDSLSKVFRT